MKDRRRADLLLVERGFFESRAKAQAAIAAGLVTVDGVRLAKASATISADGVIEAAPAHPYVSRGGLKLAAALDRFGIDPAGLVCLDVGASTGGFTEVLLLRGAARVHAIDAGRDQLHARLRADPRVVSREATDIRALPVGEIDPPAGLVAIDVSFIGLAHVLGPALAHAAPGAWLIALVKPQFEVGRAAIAKGGIVRDPQARAEAVERAIDAVRRLGGTVLGTLVSPITGGDGNEETLLVARGPV